MLKHLVCIMDGNRRWAKDNNTSLAIAYTKGVDAVKRVVQVCLQKKIPYVTLYAFSLENAKRSFVEKQMLFSLLQQDDSSFADYCVAHNMKVTIIGERDQFPASVSSVFQSLESATRAGSALHVQVLFYYGGRQEIVHAINRLVTKVQNGAVTKPITQKQLKTYLWTADVPDPDLIFRTGGYQRLSNCLLYQSAYSELYFVDTLWPDLDEAEVHSAIEYFEKSLRRYGR